MTSRHYVVALFIFRLGWVVNKMLDCRNRVIGVKWTLKWLKVIHTYDNYNYTNRHLGKCASIKVKRGYLFNMGG